jgi:O-antigen ligase
MEAMTLNPALFLGMVLSSGADHLFPPIPKPRNPKIQPLSALPSHWLLTSLFINQNKLGAGSQKLRADILVQTILGGTQLAFIIQAATLTHHLNPQIISFSQFISDNQRAFQGM